MLNGMGEAKMQDNKIMRYSFNIREMFCTRVGEKRKQRTGKERRCAGQDRKYRV